MNLPALNSEVVLALHEWRNLIQGTISYELKKRVIDSHLLGPAHASVKSIEENVKQIASRGFAARVKLTRILMRMSSALMNNNREAFERAVHDLIALGKKVSQ